jgi:hypothetical protein
MQVSAKWRYAQLQVDNGTAPERRVVSAEMMVELHRPEIAVGADWPCTRLQSWFTGEDHCVHLVYHNGANPGFRATIVLVPSSKTGIVVLWLASSLPASENLHNNRTGNGVSEVSFRPPLRPGDWLQAVSAMGHFDPFTPPRPNGRCPLS